MDYNRSQSRATGGYARGQNVRRAEEQEREEDPHKLDSEVERLRALHVSILPEFAPRSNFDADKVTLNIGADDEAKSIAGKEKGFFGFLQGFFKADSAVDVDGGSSGGGDYSYSYYGGVQSDGESGTELSSNSSRPSELDSRGAGRNGEEDWYTTDISASANRALAPPVLDASALDGLDASAGCVKCSRLFKASENSITACAFHRGRFGFLNSTSGYGRAGAKRRWTCCKEESESARGCAVGPHVENPRMTQILNTFNAAAAATAAANSSAEVADGLCSSVSSATSYETDDGDLDETESMASASANASASSSGLPSRSADNAFSPMQSRVEIAETQAAISAIITSTSAIRAQPASSALSAASSSLVGQTPRRSPDGYLLHAVSKTDTLFGLSLHYGVSVASIKQRNRISNDRDLCLFKDIKIPSKELLGESDRCE